MDSVLVRNADRMMTSVTPRGEGIELVFADGCKGVVPFADIPEVGDLESLAAIDLPNPYEIILRNRLGQSVEIPWDFARHYCDTSYRVRIEAVAARGRETLGQRIRALREVSGMTQEALARQAGISRVTLIRVEKGEQSPRFQTLVSLALALGRPIQDLLVRGEAG